MKIDDIFEEHDEPLQGVCPGCGAIEDVDEHAEDCSELPNNIQSEQEECDEYQTDEDDELEELDFE